MLLASLGVVAGLALLSFAADQFVIGAVRVAARLRLSPVVIGALVIGFGTSAPEMVVSALAAGQGSLDIAVGNIAGSNIANLTLVMGTAAMVIPLTVGSPNIRREAPLALAATVAFAAAVRVGLTTPVGLLLLVGLAAVLVTVVLGGRGDDPEIADEVAEYLGESQTGTDDVSDGPSTSRESVRTLVGLVGVLVSAQVLVVSATTIASEIGLAEGFVGLTIVAIGTSLPELATSLQAARKAETDLIVGNLLGSNVFNSLAVGGIAAIAGDGIIEDPSLSGSALLVMVGIASLATVFMATGRRVVRGEGGLLLVVWLASLPLLA